MKERVSLKDNNEKLRKVVSALKNQLQNMHEKLTNFIKATSELEKDYEWLKNEKSTISEAERKTIIEEYKNSTELIEAVMKQFTEGYQGAKDKIRAKMLAIDLDTTVLDSSDDKDEAKELPDLQNDYLYFILFFHISNL